MKPEPVQLDDRKLHPKPEETVARPESSKGVEPGEAATPFEDSGRATDSIEDLERKIIDALKTCYDPEIPVNIHELGLIYEIDIDEARNVRIKMTLTSPMCPVAGTLPGEVQAKVQRVPGVRSANVELVWIPPWTPEKMSEAAKLTLGMY
jgi:FeS assembly SUF system protein